jgi:hypothetical protein
MTFGDGEDNGLADAQNGDNGRTDPSFTGLDVPLVMPVVHDGAVGDLSGGMAVGMDTGNMVDLSARSEEVTMQGGMPIDWSATDGSGLQLDMDDVQADIVNRSETELVAPGAMQRNMPIEWSGTGRGSHLATEKSGDTGQAEHDPGRGSGSVVPWEVEQEEGEEEMGEVVKGGTVEKSRSRHPPRPKAPPTSPSKSGKKRKFTASSPRRQVRFESAVTDSIDPPVKRRRSLPQRTIRLPKRFLD